jgi:[ribosomal protein S5]-alanine N-acetyltransferase
VTPPPIVTARLVLRAPRADDLAAFHAIMSDRRAMAHWSTLPHPDLATTERWMQPMLAQAQTGHERVIECDGQVIGKAGGYRLPDVGFILRPDHWGRGYATEAMAAILPFIWATSATDHLLADVDPLNPGSLRVLAKLGFHETHRAERTFCLGGVWADSVYLRLDRPVRPAIYR